MYVSASTHVSKWIHDRNMNSHVWIIKTALKCFSLKLNWIHFKCTEKNKSQKKKFLLLKLMPENVRTMGKIQRRGLQRLPGPECPGD